MMNIADPSGGGFRMAGRCIGARVATLVLCTGLLSAGLLCATTSSLAASLPDLLARAEKAYHRGRYADSAFAYSQVAKSDRSHVLAHARGGISHTLIGYHRRAIPLLDRALELGGDDGEVLYFRGLSNFALRRYAEAESDLTRAGGLRPYFPGLWNYLGLAQSIQGKDEAAVASYSRGLKHAPRTYALRVNRGIANHFAGNSKAALADLTRAIKQRPKEALAYNNRALVHADAGNAQAARRDLEQAVKLLMASRDARAGNEAVDILLNQALVYRKHSAPERALDSLARAQSLRPDDDRAEYLKAVVLFESGKFDNAASAATSLSERPGPLQVDAALLRAKAHMNVQRYRDAALELVHVAMLEAGHREAHRILGDAYYNQARLQLAVDSYTRHLEQNPDDPVALRRRAEANYFLNQLEPALADLNALLPRLSEPDRPYRRRAEVYLRLAQFPEAIADLEAARVQSPDDGALVVRLAEAYQFSGDSEAAMQRFSEAHQLLPADASVLERRGNLLFEQSRYEEALADYRQAMQLAPQRAELHVLAAEVHLKREDAQAAIAAYDRALEINPNQATVLLNRGILLERSDRREDACRDWHNACRLGEEKGCEFAGQGC